MANLPISGLPTGVAIADTDLFADTQAVGTGPVKVTALEIKQYVGNNLTLTGTPILPATLTIGTVNYTFPASNGPSGSVLVNNGVGVLSWSTSPGVGSVTSVGLDASILGFTVSNSPITSSGNIVLDGGVLGVAYGGTGAATPAAALINLLPATAPATAGYALFNDGSGNFYWAAAGGGGGGGGGNVLSVNTTLNGLTVASPTGNAVLQGTLGIASGGTGATSTVGARNAILPAQGGNGGKVLGTDGTNASWVAVSGTGTVTSVSGSGGTTGMTLNGGPITGVGVLTLGGTLAVTNGGTGRTSLGAGVQTALGIATNSSGGFLLAGAGGVLPILQGGTGASTATAALTNLLPTQSVGTNGQVLTSNGTAAVWQSLSGVSVSSISGGTTGMSFGAGTGAVTMTGILNAANGGTGVNAAAATNGQILIGNGSGFTLNTLAAGPGVTITNASGAITISSTGGGGGVTQVTTTLSGLTVATNTTTPVIQGTLGFGSGGTGNVAVPTDGQLLIGNGAGYTLASLTAGPGIGITNSAGGITITATGTAGVTTFSGGSTGLTPAGATTGPIVLGGTLAIGFGGTGLGAVGANGTALVSNGTALVYGNPLYATNLVGGTTGAVPYQSAANTTSFTSAGATGTYLAGNGAAAPTWNAAQTTLGSTVLTLGGTQTALTGMTGILMAPAYNPTAQQDVATKDYVDNFIVPVNRVSPAAVATTTNLASLSGLAAIDGYTPIAGDRILVKNQTAAQDNGVYIAAAGGWSRATDLDAPSEFTSASVFVINGTTQANTSWIQTATITTVGTTPQVWQQQSGIYNYTAGTGIGISGYTINNNGVLSWSGGTTGLQPATATTGAVTLTGTLNITNGGTSATTAQGARTNILPTQAGQAGKFLQTNGTDVTWAASAGGAVYYIDVVSGGTVQSKITGAGYTDAVGNSYVLFNSSTSNVTLTATSFPNYLSFSDCTATSMTIYAGRTMMVTTSSIASSGTYAIDASNYGPGNVYNYSINTNSTLSAIIAAIPQVDNEWDIYVIRNTALASVTVNCGTLVNPGSLPGFLSSTTVTIPASGVALIQTVVANTSYQCLSITNSVSTNLSGGAANKIVYQTAANTTDFLPTGTAGQVLKSSGAGAAPVWATATAAFYIDAATSTPEQISAVITAAGYTDAVGALYVIYNSSAATKLISTTNLDNYLSFPTFCSSNTIALQPKQTATIVTDVVGTNYSIINISNLAGAAAVNVTASDTVSNLLTGAGVTEYNGLLVTLTNTSGSTQTITAATFNGHQAFAPATSTGAIVLDATESVTLIVTTSGSTYQLVTMSSNTTTVVSTAANYATSTAITGGFVHGDLLSITNTAATSITVTAAAFSNSGSYPSNSTSTVFTVGAGATVTLALNSATTDTWQIISYSSSTMSAVTTAAATGTITSVLTTATIVQQVGMLVTIRNTAVTSITLSGTLTNFQPWAPAASAASVIIQAGECATFRVVTPGSAYDVINVTAQNVAIDSAIDRTLTADIVGYGLQVGQLFTVTNTKVLGNVVLTAADFENTETYPVQSTATNFYLPKDGTVTLELTSATNSNWRIVSFEYPGLQAGSVVFSAASTGSTAVTTGYTTMLLPAVLNPQSFYDATTGKFQPTVAGYYQLNAFSQQTSGTGNQNIYLAFTKNGVTVTYNAGASSNAVGGAAISDVVYLNGTTDYVTLNAVATAGFTTIAKGMGFSGALVTQQNIINTSSGVYNTPTNANITIPTLIANEGITDVVNNEYIITNTNPTANVTLTATNFIGYQGWIAQASVSTIVLTPGTVAVLQTVTVGTGYQIVSISPNNNVNSVAFSAAGPTPAVAVGTNSAYPACKISLPNIYGGAATGNPQNYYDPSTSRFTPKTAGYYQVNAYTYNQGGNDYQWLKLYKNGLEIYAQAGTNDSLYGSGIQIATVVYMNGTTDYLELGSYYGATSATPPIAPGIDGNTRFNAYLTNQTNTEVVGTTAAGSANKNASQAIATATFTKVTLPGAPTDPQSWWNAANNRWIPTIPGYYEVNAMLTYTGLTANTLYEIHIVKNGFSIANGLYPSNIGTTTFLTGTANIVVYMNGTTDYLEMWTFQTSGASQNVDGNTLRTNLNISLVGANQAVPAVKQTTSAYGIGSYNASNHAARYAVAQLDNIIIYQQYLAGFGFATVTGSTQLQGSVYTLAYGGGGGCASITNTTGSGPWTITTAGAYLFSSGTMSTWVFTFRDLTAGISYRATFILQHSYQNSQCFLERIGGQQI